MYIFLVSFLDVRDQRAVNLCHDARHMYSYNKLCNQLCFVEANVAEIVLQGESAAARMSWAFCVWSESCWMQV